MIPDGRRPKDATFSGGFADRTARGLAVVTAAYAVLLFAATHYPRPEEFLGRRAPSDKLLHFVAYGILGFLAAATLRASGRWSGRAAGWLFAALAVAAVIDEVTQPLCSRAAEPLDWVFDCFGLAAGIALIASWAWARGNR
jgi:VanZ family protein